MVKLFLVRHAKAVARKDWKGDELLRPLGPLGREQADAIAERLEGEALSRIVAAPSLRCQQAMEPLTVRSGVPVEVDERLGEGESVQRALELLPRWDEGPVVFCSHGEPITALLRLFELPEGDGDPESPIPCRKGSIWLLEGPGTTPTRATYLEPVRRSGRKRGLRVEFPPSDSTTPRSIRAAVLDLGSTSFNLLIADASDEGEIRPVVREKVMLRLGAVIASNSHIPEPVCDRAVEVARELRVVAEHEKAQRLLPVATAALRDADNGQMLCERIGRALGVPVRFLSGEEEARTIFRAFQRRVALDDEPVLGVDLGGGSLELAVGSRAGVDHEVTLRLGVARLHGEMVSGDPIRKTERRALRERVRQDLAPHRSALMEAGVRRAIATGGTARALARLIAEKRVSRGPRSIWPVRLSAATLRGLTGKLVRSTHDERLQMRGMRKRRADLLPAGGVVLSTLAQELGIEHFTVSDWGLREGILLDEFEHR